MLAYLRTILHESFFKTKERNTLPLSEVSNLAFEIVVIGYYIDILKFIKDKFETTLAEDESLLEEGPKSSKMSFEMRMAILYRTE